VPTLCKTTTGVHRPMYCSLDIRAYAYIVAKMPDSLTAFTVAFTSERRQSEGR